METSATVGELVKALCAAKPKFGAVVKAKTAIVPTKEGKSYTYKYADLAAVLDAVEEPLAEHGLALLQFPGMVDGKPGLVSQLSHSSGEWMRDGVQLPPLPDKATPQNYGALLTYIRRYAACAILQIPLEDTDALDPKAKKKEERKAGPVGETISQAEQAEFFKLLKAAGLTPEEGREIMADVAAVSHTKDIPADLFPNVKAQIEERSKAKAAANA